MSEGCYQFALWLSVFLCKPLLVFCLRRFLILQCTLCATACCLQGAGAWEGQWEWKGNWLPKNLSFSSHCQNLVKNMPLIFLFHHETRNAASFCFSLPNSQHILPFVEWLKLKASPCMTRVMFLTVSNHIWTFSTKLLSDLWQYLLWCLLGTDFPPDHRQQLQRSNETSNLIPVSGRPMPHLSFLSSAYLHDCTFFLFCWSKSLSSISAMLASLRVLLDCQIAVTHFKLVLFQRVTKVDADFPACLFLVYLLELWLWY